MAMRKWFGALVAGGLVGAIAAGCSSENPSAPSDGGADGATRKMLDSGLTTMGDDASDGGGAVDGTTGKLCTMDSDCSPTGLGANKCSSDYISTLTNLPVALWPTPVCIVTPPATAGLGNCDPVPVNDGLPHYCDGPDKATSPGICVPFDPTNPQPGQGICYPLCTFGLDGTKPTQCHGTNACIPVTFLRSTSMGTVTGIGFCRGGCQQDSDCSPSLGAGFRCQTDIGYCTTALATAKRTKGFGAACSTGGTIDDTQSGACNCDPDPTTGQGYCTSACVVGGLPCPGGWTCDAGFQSPLVFTSSTGAQTSVPLSAQNIGLSGFCQPACTLADAGVVDAASPADAGADGSADAAVTPILFDGGSGGCPPNSTCSALDLAGPNCVP